MLLLTALCFAQTPSSAPPPFPVWVSDDDGGEDPDRSSPSRTEPAGEELSEPTTEDIQGCGANDEDAAVWASPGLWTTDESILTPTTTAWLMLTVRQAGRNEPVFARQGPISIAQQNVQVDVSQFSSATAQIFARIVLIDELGTQGVVPLPELIWQDGLLTEASARPAQTTTIGGEVYADADLF